MMDVNMRSVFLCTREVVPMMPAGGSIINFSLQAAREPDGTEKNLRTHLAMISAFAEETKAREFSENS